MEFKSLRNIESSFRQIRLFGIVFLSLCAVVTVGSVWNSYRFAEKQREKIYVLDNGKSLMLALSQDLSQNRPAEAREHVRRFNEMFFTLSPEKSAIEHNVKRALLLDVYKRQLHGRYRPVDMYRLRRGIVLPPCMADLRAERVNLVKNTSCLYIIGGTDLISVTYSFVTGASTGGAYAPAYLLSGLLFFVICFPLSTLASVWENSLKKRDARVTVTEEAAA